MTNHTISVLKNTFRQITWLFLKLMLLVIVITFISPAHSGNLMPLHKWM